MSTESNQQLIDDFYTALGAGDENMARFFTADVEWHLPRSSPMYGSASVNPLSSETRMNTLMFSVTPTDCRDSMPPMGCAR